MEQKRIMALMKTRKRRRPEVDMSLEDLNQDLLERVLSWLPPSSFFRLRSVCKRWSSVAEAATFRIACTQIPRREPWFLMVGCDLHHSIVYDSSEGNWKKLTGPGILEQDGNRKPIPVASSGGLVCYRTVSGVFVVCNPVTGACRELPPAGPVDETQTIHAIAMRASSKDAGSSYTLAMVSGEYPNLAANIYDSRKGIWEDVALFRRSSNCDIVGNETVYFLSKAGEVVAANMQRSPWKQYSSVMTIEGGEEVMYFLSPSGAIASCNLSQRTFLEYPRLMPMYLEHSLDVVECDGKMLAVVSSDFLESASLRVWRFSKAGQSWHQIASMPPAMSHDFYGKKADINCVGFDNAILICLNSNEANGCFACNLTTNEWVELPKCLVGGNAGDFMSAFAFEPRVEACV